MSIEAIKNEVFRFLASESPEVLAVKGDWGVGKTYSWKNFLIEALKNKSIKLNKYAYVSLFGINSLDALKFSIFESVIKREKIGKGATLETFKENAAGIVEPWFRRIPKYIKGISAVKPFYTAIEALAFLSLNKTIICLDDLERRGDGLDIKDVLGLVSLLKEEKGCKVVLLLNEDQDGLDNYRKYNEKVIDIEIEFSPSASECVEIAYSDKIGYEKVKSSVIKLGIKNIRILKRIERLLDLVLPYVQDYEPEIIEQTINSMVLYVWSNSASHSNEDIPPLDFITKRAYQVNVNSESDNNKENKDKWRTYLQKYDYKFTDEFDLVLSKVVKTGFVIKEDIENEASNKNQQLIASKAEDSISKVWDLFHNSFKDNSKEIVDGFYNSIKENSKYITPANLNSIIKLLRELNEEEKASEIIDLYIANRKNEIEIFKIDKVNIFGDLNDSEMLNKFKEHYSSSIETETAEQVLERISGESGWRKEDEEILVNTSVEEFIKLFKSERGGELSSVVATCLEFGHFSNASEQQKEIAKRAESALRKIAEESELNKIRVKRFGIQIDN